MLLYMQHSTALPAPQKIPQRTALLIYRLTSAIRPRTTLPQANATAEERAEAVSEVDDEFAGRQQDLETRTIQVLTIIELYMSTSFRSRYPSTDTKLRRGSSAHFCPKSRMHMQESTGNTLCGVLCGKLFLTLTVIANAQEMEPVHLEQQLELRQRQLREIAGTVKVRNIRFLPYAFLTITHKSHGGYYPRVSARSLRELGHFVSCVASAGSFGGSRVNRKLTEG